MKHRQKRYRSFLLGVVWCLAANIQLSGQLPVRPQYVYDLLSLSEHNPDCKQSQVSAANQSSIIFQPGSSSVRMVLPGYDDGVPFDQASYLVIDLIHHNPSSSILLLEFRRKGDEPDENNWIHSRINARIGVLPELRTQIIFPLSYLNAQEVFLPRFPRQLKGTVGGKRMSAKEIDEVYLRILHVDNANYPLSMEIAGIQLTSRLPDPLPHVEGGWVDSLGQWASKSWPGKISQTKDLQKEVEISHRKINRKPLSDDRSAFMGFRKLQFDSTGFFHLHHDDLRWWLVDPAGYAYLSVAPTGVGPYSHGPIETNPDLFSYLPPDTGYFKKAYAYRRDLKSISYLTLNLIRLYGENWERGWQNATQKLLKGLGFTGTGNWSDPLFYQNVSMPYVYPMRGFPSTKINLFRDFPDVFDPAYEKSCMHFATQLKTLANDQMMIGYFLGNEPHWAFGDFNLAREMLYKNQNSYTRNKLITWLNERYNGDIMLFSAAWEIDFSSFSYLESLIFPHEKDLTEKADDDLKKFSRLMVDQYAQVLCSAVKEADPNHLNLGLRFAWISSEACLQTGKYFDVFSLNGYSFPEPPPSSEIAEQLNMPVMIGEFHFGSVDRGLPATGIRGVASQKDRGIAYQHYIENGFVRPEIIGIHYFQWNDQLVTGRFDGENYNIGIVDVTFRPYPELAKSIVRANKRLFRVASGRIKPFSKLAKTIPNIYY
ncbi:MAG: hypothetical protein HOK84_08930 [Bacteroidetes bacterium]|nr:hypothetical protein [Bacteroidota bacterium]MBT4409645.1 hypothetical protein [Bacteroidota bacterium]MBT5426307.1 hypothetical protein [Bacteroidota bacterium]